MQNKQKTFIFIGRSGCGKGTQVELVEKKLQEQDSEMKIVKIGTGDLFRRFWSGNNTYSGELSKQIVEDGLLQPEFLTSFLLGRELVENMTGNEHLILDGVPRRLNQAEILDSTFNFYKRENPTVIYMNVSRQWSIDRLLGRGRGDDTIDDINKRLDWFDEDVVPALDYLKENPMYNFIDINGEQTIEEVFEEIKQKTNF